MKKNNEKIIDAAGKSLGRVASEIAMSLMGKTSAKFERHVYCGFPVKVTNASKIKINPKKMAGVSHFKYSGHRGGLRTIKGAETIEKKCIQELLKMAVYQMLTDNKIRREMMKNLKIEE